MIFIEHAAKDMLELDNSNELLDAVLADAVHNLLEEFRVVVQIYRMTSG